MRTGKNKVQDRGGRRVPSRSLRGMLILLCALALAAGPAGAALAQDGQDQAQAFEQGSQDRVPAFVQELTRMLEGQEGWSGQDVAALATAARDLDWDGTENADPAVVALALQLGKQEAEEMEPLDQARLALQLALVAVEMESLGYGEREVARVALYGVRDALGEMQAILRERGEADLGLLIRNRIRSQLRNAHQVRVREDALNRARERSGGAGGLSFTAVPREVTGGEGDRGGPFIP
ncbi:MAG: hypothetical protein ACOC8N_09645 [Spirochaetota bacterium]